MQLPTLAAGARLLRQKSAEGDLLPPAVVLQLHRPFRRSTFLASEASLQKEKATGHLQHPAQGCKVELGSMRWGLSLDLILEH